MASWSFLLSVALVCSLGAGHSVFEIHPDRTLQISGSVDSGMSDVLEVEVTDDSAGKLRFELLSFTGDADLLVTATVGESVATWSARRYGSDVLVLTNQDSQLAGESLARVYTVEVRGFNTAEYVLTVTAEECDGDNDRKAGAVTIQAMTTIPVPPMEKEGSFWPYAVGTAALFGAAAWVWTKRQASK